MPPPSKLPNEGALRGTPPPTVRSTSGTCSVAKAQVAAGPLTVMPVSASR